MQWEHIQDYVSPEFVDIVTEVSKVENVKKTVILIKPNNLESQKKRRCK